MNADRCSDITGVILVGGKSRRMGRDKALLPWQGVPLVEQVLRLFQGHFEQVLLVGGDGERFSGYGLTTTPDLYPGSALGGLYTGLFQATTDYIFVAPCDLPYPSGGLMSFLCTLREGYDCVVPETEHSFEPLFAVYAKSALPAMLAMLQVGNYRIYDLYPRVKTRYVSAAEMAPYLEAGRSLVNVNTPEEFARLKSSGEE